MSSMADAIGKLVGGVDSKEKVTGIKMTYKEAKDKRKRRIKNKMARKSRKMNRKNK